MDEGKKTDALASVATTLIVFSVAIGFVFLLVLSPLIGAGILLFSAAAIFGFVIYMSKQEHRKEKKIRQKKRNVNEKALEALHEYAKDADRKNHER